MAGNNRAVENPDQPPAPAVVVPSGARVEGLPATGVFGKSPSMAIAFIMFAAKFVIAYLVARGYTPPVTPEIQSMADRFGPDVAAMIVSGIIAAPALIQGYWTKLRVFSPRSVYKRYVAPLFNEK